MKMLKSNPGMRSQRTAYNGFYNSPVLSSVKGMVIYPNKNKNEKGTVSGITIALLLLHSSFSTIGTV
jgi:hypothetical protein